MVAKIKTRSNIARIFALDMPKKMTRKSTMSLSLCRQIIALCIDMESASCNLPLVSDRALIGASYAMLLVLRE